ncbi:ATP-binding protein [Deinococcus sonorensis]|uniref:LuxR C-terminal-related transcriptional regulator n=2 Tax=Deinococcus sonorensis TaxID=309891 RepID=A0AAU7U516_9DEIO
MPLSRPPRLERSLRGLQGRERELGVCAALLQRRDVRLVTLTGMGGVGKTRLAVRLAHDLQDAFADGACLVSLAAVTQAELVPQAVAAALGVGGEQLAVEAVFAALRSARMLLVLDNLEHLLDAAGFVAELLLEAPGVCILATSRAPLQLSGEHEVTLGPLGLPEASDLASDIALRSVPAVALFVERASEVRPQLTWDLEALQRVARIVTRLGGWPLSLELAAARLRLFSLDALGRALEAPLEVLTRGPRDLPARQQSLRATLDWSYGLLRPEEQRLLAWLAVFPGTFTPEEVGAALGAVGRLDVLAALVEHGWVGRAAQDGGLSLLEPVREYALEKLKEADALDAAREAHARFYLTRLEAQFAAGSPRADRARYLTWVTATYPHLRSALSWAIASGTTALALRLERGLYQFWMAGNGLVDEGRVWAETLLLHVQDSDQATRAHLHNVIGHLALMQGEPLSAALHHERALALARALGNPVLEANTMLLLAQARQFSGPDLSQTEALIREARARYTTLEDRSGQQGATMSLVMVLHAQGRDAEALQCVDTLAPEVHPGHTPLLRVQVLVWSAWLRIRLGQTAEAPALLADARRVAEGLPSPVARSSVERVYGEWALATGQPGDAQAHFTRALEEARRASVPGVLASITEALGRAAEALGDPEGAAALYRQVVERDAGRVAPQVAEAASAALARLSQATGRQGSAPQHPARTTPLTDLTARETEVLALVARGDTNGQIAAALGITLPTVNAHLRTIFSKLGVASRVLATRVALERGLIRQD